MAQESEHVHNEDHAGKRYGFTLNGPDPYKCLNSKPPRHIGGRNKWPHRRNREALGPSITTVHGVFNSTGPFLHNSKTTTRSSSKHLSVTKIHETHPSTHPHERPIPSSTASNSTISSLLSYPTYVAPNEPPSCDGSLTFSTASMAAKETEVIIVTIVFASPSSQLSLSSSTTEYPISTTSTSAIVQASQTTNTSENAESLSQNSPIRAKAVGIAGGLIGTSGQCKRSLHANSPRLGVSCDHHRHYILQAAKEEAERPRYFSATREGAATSGWTKSARGITGDNPRLS